MPSNCQLGSSVIVGGHDSLRTRKDDRKELAFFLPEDPGAASVRSTLHFVGRNLTMDHVIEVDLNGVKVDAGSFTYEKLLHKSGTPDRQYANIVAIPLAGTAAVTGGNILGVRMIRSNPEIPFKRASKYGAMWGGFTITEVEAFFEPD